MTISDEAVKREFGNKVRELRNKNKLSQEDLAGDIGMDLTTVNEIEMGHRDPKLSTIYKISVALGVNIGDLIE